MNLDLGMVEFPCLIGSGLRARFMGQCQGVKGQGAAIKVLGPLELRSGRHSPNSSFAVGPGKRVKLLTGNMV